MVLTSPAIKYNHNQIEHVQDVLTVEEMLQVSINGESYTTTMRSPGNEEELVRGILLTEDVYVGKNNPAFFITEKNEQDYVVKVNVLIPEEQLGAGMNTKRNLMSVTSCGVCGKYEMDLALLGTKLNASVELLPNHIANMFAIMKAGQVSFEQTGGCHASAAFTSEGTCLALFEDIGRHNAVDKVIGSLAMKGLLPSKGNSHAPITQITAYCLLVSGRVSYEIVSKCYRAGIPYLAAVSAPSSMAVQYCKEKGITLLAFCRGDKMTKYT
jgi:FdhD protein